MFYGGEPRMIFLKTKIFPRNFFVQAEFIYNVFYSLAWKMEKEKIYSGGKIFFVHLSKSQ